MNTKTLKSDESVHKCLLHIYGLVAQSVPSFSKTAAAKKLFRQYAQ